MAFAGQGVSVASWRFWLGNTFEGVTPYHMLVFLGCWLGGIFDGMDSSLYMVVQHDAISEVAGITDRAVISALGSRIMFTFLFGWMLGGIFFGMIGDRFGRVTAMVISILLYALFTGAAGFAQTSEQLALCRFLTGFGIGGELVTIATMLSETWPEKSRAFVVGTLITSYQVGVFLAGLIPAWVYEHADAVGFSPWRIVFFIGALPAVLAVLVRLRLDEPEKWKAQRHSSSSVPDQNNTNISPPSPGNALAALSKHFVPLFQKDNLRDLFVGGSIFGGLLVGYWASLAWIPTWIQDMIGPDSDGTEKSIATMYHGIAAVVGCFSSGILANWIGRRFTVIIASVGAFGATALLMLTNENFSPAIYWQDALLGFFIGLIQAVMYIYLPELFKTRIRATAMGFCLNMGRFVTAIAVLFIGALVTFFGGYEQTLLIFSGAYLLAALVGAFGRETRGQVLPD